MSLLIKNVNIIDESKDYIADMFIEDEKIKAIGNNLDVKADEIIDGTGKILLPGGIDVHTHFDLDLGQFRAVDDWYTGTKASAFGGTTTVVDHIAFGPRGCTLKSMLDNYHNLAKDKALIDYGFHGVIQDVNTESIEEIGEIYKDGTPSMKLYTTYGGMLQDDEILWVLKKAKETGMVICVHCENDGSIALLRKECGDNGQLTPIYHAKSRPNETEAEAVNRLIYLSELADYPYLYIVHTSTKEALDEIIIARKRGVKNLYCETCTQYLTLTEDEYKREGYEGLKYIISPPLRKNADIEALWKGIEDGEVDVVATDHCPFFFERDKMYGKDDFRITPGGAPGVEERMEIMLTEGENRNISKSKLVEILVTNPAKIFGLYPSKGTLNIGSDGDVVLYEKKDYTISQKNRHSIVDYTPYEGFKSKYKVSTVIQRGNILVDGGKLLAEKGQGKFIPRYK